MRTEPLLSVRDLRAYFHSDNGPVKAVDGVSFHVNRGKALAIVGESGCGKSVANLSILRLIPRPPGYFPSGEVRFGGKDLLRIPEREMRAIRGDRISMIFQDPMTSLNPFLTIERQLTEVLETHKGMTHRQARTASVEILGRVGIPDPAVRIRQHPHEFSGGMRQRVMIAMALLCEPELLIADEPTTALDVTIAAQILSRIDDFRRELKMGLILITHDLGIVAGMADRVLVMYAGKVVEEGIVDEIFGAPRHPYTAGLLKSLPKLKGKRRDRLDPIPGMPPDLSRLPAGCPFAPRCGYATERCRAEYPDRVEFGVGHWSACWEAKKL
ncbi:MAG: ABC transporter ATP-binding protein [Pseudomonadota bacterium]